MAATQLGAVPEVQLASLPLISAQAAASGGAVSRNLGGGITRFWDSTTLGITAATPTAFGGATLWLVSIFLDTTGCRSFNLLLRRLNNTALAQGALAGTVQIYYQMRFSATEVPLLSQGATENLSSLAITAVSNASIGGFFPALQTQGETQTGSFGWDLSLGASGAGNNGCTSLGSNVRILIGFSIAPSAANTFSVTLTGVS